MAITEDLHDGPACRTLLAVIDPATEVKAIPCGTTQPTYPKSTITFFTNIVFAPETFVITAAPENEQVGSNIAVITCPLPSSVNPSLTVIVEEVSQSFSNVSVFVAGFVLKLQLA